MACPNRSSIIGIMVDIIVHVYRYAHKCRNGDQDYNWSYLASDVYFLIVFVVMSK